MPAGSRVHLALWTKSKKVVDAVYEAAIAAGGKDNGPPAPWSNYYAAYAL